VREARFDVVGLGNAIVDVLAHTSDAFLARHGMAKGAMTLIEADRAVEIYRLMGNVDLFPMHTQPPSDDCVCGRHIQTVLTDVFTDAQQAMEKVLAGLTVQDIEEQIEDLEESGLCEPC